MFRVLPRASCAMAIVLSACTGPVTTPPPPGAIHGVVAIGGTSQASKLTVTLTGPINTSTVTDGSGAFSFTGLPAGRYLLTAAAPSTREGVSTAVVDVASADVDAGTLGFTGVGNLGGRALLSRVDAPLGGTLVSAVGADTVALTDSSGTYVLRGLRPGHYRVQAFHDGFVGAVSDPVEVRWNEDTAVPELMLASATPTSTGPTTSFIEQPAALTAGTATFAFISSAPHAIFKCGLDAAPMVECTSPRTLTGLATGAHTFTVASTDASGTTDPSPARYTWTVDATPPVTTITAQPPAVASGSTAAFSFTSSKSPGSFLCTIDGAGPDACTSPRTLTVSTGSHVFTVAAVDQVGNVDPAPPSVSWTSTAGGPSATPLLTFGSVAPNPVRNGQQLSITFSADRPLDGCSASVAGQAATCAAPAGASCTCLYTVVPSVVEGNAFILAFASRGTGTGTTTGSVNVDKTPPSISPGGLRINRKPLGANDSVSAGAGTFLEPAPTYPGQKVALVKLWVGGAVVATVAPLADGSLPETELPATDGTSAARLAPLHVQVSAVDVPGNESPRIAISAGDESSGPAVSQGSVTIHRRAVGTLDGVQGAAGSLAPAACALVQAAVYDGAGTQLGAGPAAGDGSFAEVLIGSGTSSAAQVQVAAVDKCGQTGQLSPIANGAESQGPSGDGTRMTIARRDLTRPDGASGSAGAFSSTCATASVQLFSDGGGSTLLASGPVKADGSFAEIVVGTKSLAPAQVFAQATDKCGLVGAIASIANGNVAGPASGDGSLIAIARTDLAQRDSVRGAAGAFSGGCYPATVALADADSGSALASAAARADGSFGPVAIGSNTVSAAGVSATLTDKCGQASDAALAQVGVATNPPALDRTKMTYQRAPDGLSGKLSGAAGAVLDPVSVVREVRVFLAPAGGSPILTPIAPDSTGAFGSPTPLSLGTVDQERLYIEAVNKAGLLTATRVVPSNVQATLNLSGRVRYSDAKSMAGLYSFAGPRDPRAQGPGAALQLAPEVSTADSAGAAAIDLARAQVSASSQDAVGAGWSLVRAGFRGTATGVYDSGRNRYVIFGGSIGDAPIVNINEHLEFDGVTWTRIVPATLPPARAYASMVYDSKRSRVVLFGGRTTAGTFLNDTWEYDGTNWTQSSATGPSARAGAQMAWDSTRNLTVLFGGEAQVSNRALTQSDTWEYDGTHWTQIATPTSATSRWLGSIAYDSFRARMVIFGGQSLTPGGCCGGSNRTLLQDTWEYSGGNWTQAAPPTAVPGRYRQQMAFDPVRRTVVMVAGDIPYCCGESPNGDTWEYDGSDWTQISPPQPAISTKTPMVFYDSAKGRIVEFDNDPVSVDQTSDDPCHFGLYDGTTWTFSTIGSGPPNSGAPLVVFDAGRQAVLTIGPQTGSSFPVWENVGGVWAPGIALNQSGQMVGLAYDARRGKTVALLNTGDSPTLITVEYDGASWIQAAPAHQPPRRSPASVAYDSARGRLVLCGGSGDSGLLNDTWSYDGNDWTRIITAISPTARSGQALVYDGTRDRVQLFGGSTNAGALADLWEFDGANWGKVAVPAPLPPVDSRPVLVFDPVRSVIAHWAGGSGNHWEYTASPSPKWTLVTPSQNPGQRQTTGLVWDSVNGRVLLFGGSSGYPYNSNYNDLWSYDVRAPAPRTAAQQALFTIDPGATVSSLTPTYVGAGAAPSGGSSAPGVELLAWSFAQSKWVSLGTQTAADADSAAARTVAPGALANPAAFAGLGRIWFLFAPAASSTASGATPAIPSSVSTDFIELKLTYTLP